MQGGCCIFVVVVLFPLQLPYYISGEASHVGADLERNRECLIKLSRNLFSSVINGLATILKNLSLVSHSHSLLLSLVPVTMLFSLWLRLVSMIH